MNHSGTTGRRGAPTPSHTTNGFPRTLGVFALALLGLGGLTAHAARPLVNVTADITASTTWTSDNDYVLGTIIKVTNSATLTIQPGTVIRGLPDSATPGTYDPGTLVITPGAQIIANGTPAEPIVFTDQYDDNVPGGDKTDPLYNSNFNNNINGRWGGLVVMGRTYVARNSVGAVVPNNIQQVEGIPGDDTKYGGSDDDDNSGSLSYLSIRYGGAVLSSTNEINGLTLCAVGRGTTVHHIESVNCLDDAFEWFGGTVNSKYLVAWNQGDDGFDTDFGYRGKVQFGLVVKGAGKANATYESGLSNKAMEMDGTDTENLSLPYSLAQWRNLTLIGMAGTASAAAKANSDQGLIARLNARPQIYHSIIMDMGSSGVEINGVNSQAGWTTDWNAVPVSGAPANMYTGQAQGKQCEIADCLFYNNGGTLDVTGIGLMTGKDNVIPGTSPIRALTRSLATSNGTLQMVSSLDPRATSVAQGITRSLGTESFFDTVTFRGAFGPTSNWAEGWTLISSMGVLDTSRPKVNVTADITASTTWTSDNDYVLATIIKVTNNATLTIEPGTVIRGLPDSETPGTYDPGTLVITPGARIIANGTPAEPIVFTDQYDDNVPGGAKIDPLYNSNFNNNINGRWGGLVLMGKTYVARNSVGAVVPNNIQQVEGIPGDDTKYGGSDDDDNSGSLSYISIRYSGAVLSSTNEINGLTLCAVGRGTTVHHIESVNCLDDAFEWFGGTVNSKYLVAWNQGDDGFDTDFGYRGKVQFGLVVKGAGKANATYESGLSNKAMEMDGTDTENLSLPYSLAQWRNLTLIGMAGTASAAAKANSDQGLIARLNSRPQIYHSIIMDMGSSGVEINGVNSQAGWTTDWNAVPVSGAPANMYTGQAQGKQCEIADCLFYNNGGTLDVTGIGLMTGKDNVIPGTSPIRTVTRSLATSNGTLQMVSSLDPRATSVAQGITRSLGTESFFDTVTFRGAFGPTSNWADGWTLISSMGVLDTSAPVGTTVPVTADITSSTTWTSANTYLLSTIVKVTNNATLTIEPGTVIRGLPDSETPGTYDPGTLVITPGAKIIANGTVANPIVFTDQYDDNVPGGAKTDPLYNSNFNNNINGRWGGLVLMGKTYVARNSVGAVVPNNIQQVEGIPGDDTKYGGSDDDDNSGSLSYISIRYSGAVLSSTNEINGLTLCAVGRGTTVHHIESVNCLDDAFEWFGGTVNSKYLVAWNQGDDGFDTDFGYRGKVQFGLVVKGASKPNAAYESGLSNKAMEMDGTDSENESLPYSLAQWRNLTLIGMAGTASAAAKANSDQGIIARLNSRPQIYHSIIMDMGSSGVEINGPNSIAGWTTDWNAVPVSGAPANMYTGQAQGKQCEIADCLFYNNSGTLDVKGVGILTDATKQNTVPASSPILSLVRSPAASNGTLQMVSSLNPRPTAVALGVNRSLGTENFFDTVAYRGAFGSDDTWADGWTLISAMGVLTAGSASVTQTINLVQGWNWVSFNTIPGDNSLENMLAHYGPQDNDEFKTAGNLGGSATYFGGEWFGLEGGIQPGVMYLLKKQAAGAATIQVTGAPASSSASITLVQGWNWVGFNGQSITPVNTAMSLWSPANATDNDELKTSGALGGSATYFGGQWYGIDGGLRPGVGYKLKVQKTSPGALIFGQ